MKATWIERAAVKEAYRALDRKAKREQQLAYEIVYYPRSR